MKAHLTQHPQKQTPATVAQKLNPQVAVPEAPSMLSRCQRTHQVWGMGSSGLQNRTRRYRHTAQTLNSPCSRGPQSPVETWRYRQGTGGDGGTWPCQHFGSHEHFWNSSPSAVTSHTEILILKPSWATWAGFSTWIYTRGQPLPHQTLTSPQDWAAISWDKLLWDAGTHRPWDIPSTNPVQSHHTVRSWGQSQSWEEVVSNSFMARSNKTRILHAGEA